jgi:hypothetical protein
MMIAIDEQSTVLQQFLFIPVEMKSATLLSATPKIIPFAPSLAARICIWAVQVSIEAGGSQAKFLHEVASTTPRIRALGFCKTVLSGKTFTLLIVWLSMLSTRTSGPTHPESEINVETTKRVVDIFILMNSAFCDLRLVGACFV